MRGERLSLLSLRSRRLGGDKASVVAQLPCFSGSGVEAHFSGSGLSHATPSLTEASLCSPQHATRALSLTLASTSGSFSWRELRNLLLRGKAAIFI